MVLAGFTERLIRRDGLEIAILIIEMLALWIIHGTQVALEYCPFPCYQKHSQYAIRMSNFCFFFYNEVRDRPSQRRTRNRI